MKIKKAKKGFSLVELLISIAILTAVGIILSKFEGDIFAFTYTLRAGLGAQLDGRHVVRVMVTELRKATPSATGTYPIATASSSAITFFSDVNGDGIQDQIRYFQSGSVIKRGIIIPTGSPLTYNSNNEVVTNLVSSVISSSTQPLFQYYTSSYAGTSSPLASPIDISAIRLIKIKQLI